jgi:hypothetical protein
MQKRFTKIVVLTGCAMLLTLGMRAQTIVGQWQLTNQTSCMDSELSMTTPNTEELVADMKSMSSTGAAPQIIRFKDNNTGEESTKIISHKKSYNPRSFLYKFSDETLYILDKRSQTIVESFIVEKLSADSLIITNSSRACETKVFVRLK